MNDNDENKVYYPINNSDFVSVKLLGNNLVFTKMKYVNRDKHIKKIDKNNYEVIKTGEVKKFKHNSNNRINNIQSAKNSMRKLKEYIECNVTPNITKTRFVTLTYKNEAEYKECKKDTKQFIRKLNNKKYKVLFKYNSFNYIAVYEPQGRGSFHTHLFLIFDNDKVKISNKEMESIWQKGFCYVEKPKEDCDSIANYFCYMFESMTTSEIKTSELSLEEFDAPISKEIIGPRGGKKTKKVVKGARLKLMKSYNRLFSTSKNISKPILLDSKIKCLNAKIKYGLEDKPDNASTFTIMNDENKILNSITKETYKITKKDDENT